MATEMESAVRTIIRASRCRPTDVGGCQTCNEPVDQVVEIEVGQADGRMSHVYRLRFCRACAERLAGVLRGVWRS